jgi:hypothetical protein
MVINLVGENTTFAFEVETATLVLIVCVFFISKFLISRYINK